VCRARRRRLAPFGKLRAARWAPQTVYQRPSESRFSEADSHLQTPGGEDPEEPPLSIEPYKTLADADA